MVFQCFQHCYGAELKLISKFLENYPLMHVKRICFHGPSLKAWCYQSSLYIQRLLIQMSKNKSCKSAELSPANGITLMACFKVSVPDNLFFFAFVQ